MNGLPGLRLLPDAPVPDGRTVLTEPEARNGCNDSVIGRGGISRPFIPVTNSIEALHRQLRKISKTRGHFPTEDAARKLIYLAIEKAEAKWKRVFHWPAALAAFKIEFGDRIPDSAM
jgi:putative transposase